MENFIYSTDSSKDQFVKMVFERAKQIFGDDLANPIQEPKRFDYQMRVVQFSLERDKFLQRDQK